MGDTGFDPEKLKPIDADVFQKAFAALLRVNPQEGVERFTALWVELGEAQEEIQRLRTAYATPLSIANERDVALTALRELAEAVATDHEKGRSQFSHRVLDGLRAADVALGKSEPPKHPTTLFAIGYDYGWRAMLHWIEINEPSLFNEWVDEAEREMQEKGPPPEWRNA